MKIENLKLKILQHYPEYIHFEDPFEEMKGSHNIINIRKKYTKYNRTKVE